MVRTMGASPPPAGLKVLLHQFQLRSLCRLSGHHLLQHGADTLQVLLQPDHPGLQLRVLSLQLVDDPPEFLVPQPLFLGARLLPLQVLDLSTKFFHLVCHVCDLRHVLIDRLSSSLLQNRRRRGSRSQV